MADVENRLVVRMETTLRNFERQMARAQQVANTTATGVEGRFTKMGNRMGQSSDRAAKGLGNVINLSSRGRFVVQNAANQIGDMAVQLEGGAGAARALGQQLPQLFGGFAALGGSLGIVAPLLGTIAAIGIPIAAAMINFGRGTEEAKESLDEFVKAVKVLEDAVDIARKPLSDLREEFGDFAEAVRDSAIITAQAAATQALTAFNQVSDGIRRNIADTLDALVEVQKLEDAYARLEEQQRQGVATSEQLLVAAEALEQVRDIADDAAAAVGLTTHEALLLEAALSALDDTDSMEAIAKGASEAQSVIKSIFPATKTIPPEVARIVAELDRVIRAAALAAGAVDDIGDAAASAAADAERLGASLAALGGASGPDDARTQVQEEFTPGGLRRDDIVATIRRPARRATGSSGGGRRSRRSGGGGRSRQAEPSFSELAEREIQNLQRQIELLGKTASQVAELEAKHKLLDEAKRRGLDLDRQSAATGETLRQEIDRQSASIGKLAGEYENARERAEYFESAQQKLQDGFIDAIVEGENLSGVLQQLAKDLAKAALQAALFNDGPFARDGGGTGLLGGIFGAIFKPRASGGPVAAGQPYMVGEKGPEPFFPAVNGRVLSTSQAQDAMRGSGGAVTVVQNFSISANGDDSVRQIVRREMPTMAEAAKAAVLDAKRRGGSYGRQF